MKNKKRIVSLILCICLMLALGSPMPAAFAIDDLSEEQHLVVSSDSTDVESNYNEATTLYDLSGEVDAAIEPEEEPAPAEEPAPESEADIYGNLSFDAENAEQLSGEYAQALIVKFKPVSEFPGKEKQYQQEIKKLNKIGFIEGIDAYVIKVDDLEQNPNGVLNRLKNNIFIESVEPDYVAFFDYIPNDPSFTRAQGPVKTIGAVTGWDILKGSDYAPIAVIDSGVASTHPDLPLLRSGYSAVSGLAWNNDKYLHGTYVAGVIGAMGDNGLGGVGLNWNANITSVKIDDSSCTVTASNVAKGIIWAADNGAKVLNLSLGFTSDSSTIRSAVDYAYNKGCAIFAATGNAGKNVIDYPARYSNVMAVGSVDNAGTTRVSTSNYGTGLDVMALGYFYSTGASGGYATVGGTSFATPQVSALASLLWGINPKLTNAQIYDLIRKGASGNGSMINSEFGYGVINIEKSLKLAGGVSETSQPPETPQDTRTAPTITLTGFSAMTLAYGQAYTEMGYSAVDCKGLNLTSQVKVTSDVDIWNAGLYTVTYNVTDSTGLSARATRSVTVNPKPVDPPPATAPKITINGSNPIILHSTSATAYTEQSARAVDHDGSDISSLVKVSGSINRTTPGTYTLTYSVTSPKTNLTSITTRDVRIVAPTEKRDPRTVYGLSGQAKTGGKVTHTGIVSSAIGYMDFTLTSIDKSMTISVEMIDSVTKKSVTKDTFTAAGTKQYRIDKSTYELVVTVVKAKGCGGYAVQLLMPETEPYMTFEDMEVPLATYAFSPKIAPIGSNPIILHLGGTPYKEQGARAEDYLGNDISGRVTISGIPDTSKAGIYWVTYSIVDDEGEESIAMRQVQVLAPNEFGIFEEEEVPLSDLPDMEKGIYVVAPGDSLWSIAKEQYGNGNRWCEIYDLNKKVIGNDPNYLRIGQVLTIK